MCGCLTNYGEDRQRASSATAPDGDGSNREVRRRKREGHLEDEALIPYIGLNLMCFVYFLFLYKKAHKQYLEPTKKDNLNKILVL